MVGMRTYPFWFTLPDMLVSTIRVREPMHWYRDHLPHRSGTNPRQLRDRPGAAPGSPAHSKGLFRVSMGVGGFLGKFRKSAGPTPSPRAITRPGTATGTPSRTRHPIAATGPRLGRHRLLPAIRVSDMRPRAAATAKRLCDS